MRARRMLVLVVGALVAVAGCRTTGPQQSRLMTERVNLSASAAELRVMVRDLAVPFSGTLEETSDAVADLTEEPQLRRATLEWKINVIPAMNEALFRRDPMAAVLDAAMLLAQMEQFFQKTFGEDWDPRERAVVDEGVGRMWADLERVLSAAGADPLQLDETWTLIEQWARETPITHTFASRRSSAGRLAAFTATTRTSALATVASLQGEVEDLTARVDAYAAVLGKQARWQAELLLLEALDADGDVAGALERLLPVPIALEELPSDLAAEREAILAALAAERELVLEWIRSERLQTLGFISSERLAVMAAVGAERDLLLEAIAREREAVLDAVSTERLETMEQLDKMVSQTVVAAKDEVVDHFFLRLVQLLAVALPLVFLGLFVLVWYARRPR